MEKSRIRDPGWKKVGSGIRDPGETSRIRNTDCLHDPFNWTPKWHIERKQNNAFYSMYHPVP
jgi:hypothetical protein